MVGILVLEDDDKILDSDYCRPLSISYSLGDNVYTESTYGGTPINNMKWVEVRYVFGKCWYGKTVGQLNKKAITKYEFIRGVIPKSHLLDVSSHIPLSS